MTRVFGLIVVIINLIVSLQLNTTKWQLIPPEYESLSIQIALTISVFLGMKVISKKE